MSNIQSWSAAKWLLCQIHTVYQNMIYGKRRMMEFSETPSLDAFDQKWLERDYLEGHVINEVFDRLDTASVTSPVESTIEEADLALGNYDHKIEEYSRRKLHVTGSHRLGYERAKRVKRYLEYRQAFLIDVKPSYAELGERNEYGETAPAFLEPYFADFADKLDRLDTQQKQAESSVLFGNENFWTLLFVQAEEQRFEASLNGVNNLDPSEIEMQLVLTGIINSSDKLVDGVDGVYDDIRNETVGVVQATDINRNFSIYKIARAFHDDSTQYRITKFEQYQASIESLQDDEYTKAPDGALIKKYEYVIISQPNEPHRIQMLTSPQVHGLQDSEATGNIDPKELTEFLYGYHPIEQLDTPDPTAFLAQITRDGQFDFER